MVCQWTALDKAEAMSRRWSIALVRIPIRVVALSVSAISLAVSIRNGGWIVLEF